MRAGAVNFLALVGALAIFSGAIFVAVLRAKRRGGRKLHKPASPPKAHFRKVNPKTGQLFP